MRFFDHNATTPLLPEAKAAWLEASESHWLNPSSPYRAAAATHARMEAARERLACLLEVDPCRVVFNSGATEGNNAVFAHWSKSLRESATIAVGATEHPSVLEPAKRYFENKVDLLQPDASGVIRPESLGEGSIGAVSVMAANNETGVLNPWSRWVEACRGRGLPFHCDVSQWVGKMPLPDLGRCDYLTACGHKFGGPRGVGFLLVPEGFAGGFAGGIQEQGRRAGTEDVAGILAMVAALEACEGNADRRTSAGKARFNEGLTRAIPGVRFIGAEAPTLWNTVSVIMPRFGSARWIRSLEKRGFLISAGSACSSGKQGPSHVLAAMGLETDAAGRTLRISSGPSTTAEDWDALLEAFVDSHASLLAEPASGPSKVISI